MLHGRSVISIEKDPVQVAAAHTRIAQWKNQMESEHMTKEAYQYLKLTCTSVTLKGADYMRQLWNEDLLGPFDPTATEVASIEKDETDLLSQSLRVSQVELDSEKVVEEHIPPPALRAPLRIDGIVKPPLSLTALFMEYTSMQADDPSKLRNLSSLTDACRAINNFQYQSSGEVLMCHKTGSTEESQCFTQAVAHKGEKRGNAVGICIGCHKPCCSVHALVPVGFLNCQDGAFIQCSSVCIPALVMRALYQPLIDLQDKRAIKLSLIEAIEAVPEWTKIRSTTVGGVKRYSSWIREDKQLGKWPIRQDSDSRQRLPGYPVSMLLPPSPDVAARDFLKDVAAWVHEDEEHKATYIRCLTESMMLCLDPLELPESKEARDSYFGEAGAHAGESKEEALVQHKEPEYFGGSAMMDVAVKLIGAPSKEQEFSKIRDILGPSAVRKLDLTTRKRIAARRQCEFMHDNVSVVLN